MWLILLEALAALLIFVFIIWWTMFSGRHRGERTGERNGERKVGRHHEPHPPSRPPHESEPR